MSYDDEIRQLDRQADRFAMFFMAIIAFSVAVISLPVILFCALVWLSMIAAIAGLAI